MNNSTILITFASWEDRFLARFKDDLEQRPITNVVVFYLHEFADWSAINRAKASILAQERGVKVSEICLSVSAPAQNWRQLLAVIPKHVIRSAKVLVDLTTMPRDFIWTICWFLDYVAAEVEYVYSKPEAYNKSWLSRDPQRPRLIYKMSGITDPSKRVCLILVAGYDVERAHQLISFYEPAVTFLGMQAGEAGSINNSKMDEIKRRFGGEPEQCCFLLDAYSKDHGEEDILTNLGSFFETHNVVMSSLGPKLSAIALYRIQKRYSQAALSYAPSREFNEQYSKGIGDTFWGKL